MAKHKYVHAPIAAFLLVKEIIKEAKENKELVLLIGSTGFAKSSSINYAVQKDKDLIYSIIRPAQKPRPYFSGLVDTLNGIAIDENAKPKESLDWFIQASSFELIEKSKNGLLIIDEAGNFSKGAQSYIRQLWDNIKGHSGLIISGPDRYGLNLKDWNRDLSSGIPELVSRIDRTVYLPKPSSDDVKLICQYNKIDDKRVINYIFRNSSNLRHIRNYVMAHHSGNSPLD